MHKSGRVFSQELLSNEGVNEAPLKGNPLIYENSIHEVAIKCKSFQEEPNAVLVNTNMLQ